MDAMTDAGKLAQDLEIITGKALKWAGEVLDLPIDDEKPGLLRAQAAAMQAALNTQLRADALRLRAALGDKALESLIKLMREKELSVPADRVIGTKESCSRTIGLLGSSDVSPSV